MPAITYAQTSARHMAQIHADGRYVGLLVKDDRHTGPGHYYVFALFSDPRKPSTTVRNRSLLTEIIADRVATHPNLDPHDDYALPSALPAIPF